VIVFEDEASFRQTSCSTSTTIKAVIECFRVHPKPHVHAMGKDGSLAVRICRHNRVLQEQYRMWFVPLQSCGQYFVFLGFPLPKKGEGLPADLSTRLARLFVGVGACIQARELLSRVEVTERFVKEVGHDIASAVQATVAKLRTIIDGRIDGEGARHKAKEVELEIWDAYRVAESLGIAVDSDYKLRQPEDFDLCLAIKSVLRHFGSEAAERHIRFKYETPERGVYVWGEKAGVMQAVGQLISNAVKYSLGGNDVFVSVVDGRDDIVIRVVDKGIPLPSGAELKQIWDFGYRGRNAKERHVNGSGIGLYSVKKIVSAHHGWTDGSTENGVTEFRIHLPSKAMLKKDLGILL
jgi:signal transduction histidine kinase